MLVLASSEECIPKDGGSINYCAMIINITICYLQDEASNLTSSYGGSVKDFRLDEEEEEEEEDSDDELTLRVCESFLLFPSLSLFLSHSLSLSLSLSLSVDW